MRQLVVLSMVLLSAINVTPQGFLPQGFGLNQVPILNSYSDQQLDGSFQYGYETGNGIQVQSQGVLKPIPVVRPDGVGTSLALVQSGSYSYPSPDGTIIEVRWTADENGFHPQIIRSPAAPVPVVPSPVQVARGLPGEFRFRRVARVK
ncbi:endocuticle structural glycoprotein ABD-4-like [Armigeres subalbatus]|uniref:endocuticle structural glycoprotein ABD-4-like n=1 Tax=Armigeres subalbatus TaxID=124917 RepID=UPI002ED3C192